MVTSPPSGPDEEDDGVDALVIILPITIIAFLLLVAFVVLLFIAYL